MDTIQKMSAYYGKQIVNLNTDPDVEFEDKFSKLTFRDMLKIALKLPDKLLDLKYGEIIEMALRSDEEVKAFMEEAFDGLTEEQEVALDELLKILF